MQQRLAVVILHYGDPKLTSRLHGQLLESDPEWDALFVLDNAAPEPYPDSWVRLTENKYWTGALTYALDRLGSEGFSHVWFLNNDLYFSVRPPILKTAWQRMLRMEKTLGPIGIYSPSVSHNPYHPHMVQDTRYQYRRVTFVDGIAPLFNLECIRALGGIDASGNKYGYGVDVALSLSAHAAGWPVVVDHQVGIKHVYHSTARTVGGFMEKAARAEDTYMRRVFGEDWRSVVEQAKAEFSDFDSI